MKRKALFFDIDGTLLVDASKELPKSAAAAITEARRRRTSDIHQFRADEMPDEGR